MLKDLTEGASAHLQKLSKESHETKPPARLNEASLLRQLEMRNIGRPATYASIVSLIQERGYVMKVGGRLVPTFLGFAVSRLLRAKFPKFTSYEYTSLMEEELEAVAEGRTSREAFLADFWEGPQGFQKLLEELSATVDWSEIEAYTTTSLGNGYSVKVNHRGVWLQDDEGKVDERGFKPSAKLPEDALVDDYLDPEVCKKTIATSGGRAEVRDLGELPSGAYQGWAVVAREGRFGPFLQASDPQGKQAVNHPLPEGSELATVTLEEVLPLFQEVKLPRWSEDKKLLVGVGKRGPYMGRKASSRARPVFRNLPEGLDPRTVSFEEVEAAWAAAESEAKASSKASGSASSAGKKPAAKRAAPAKRAAAKKPAAPKKSPEA